jgi:hypothetical protein
MNRKALAIVCSSAMAVGGMFLFTGANSPTKAAVPAPFTSSQHFSGYSTGTDVFVDALKELAPPGGELTNVNSGFSAAAANSNGLLSQYVPTLPAGGSPAHAATQALNATPNGPGGTGGTGFSNEMGHAVLPPQLASFGNTPTDPFQSYGRGSGVEAGLGVTLPNNPDVNQAILVGLAEQAAAPKTPGGNTFPDNSITKEGAANVNPLLYADLLKGQAAGNWDPTNCPGAGGAPGFPIDNTSGTNGLTNTLADMGFGAGNVADLRLLNTGMGNISDPNAPVVVSTTGPQPNNPPVSNSTSFVHMVPNKDINGVAIPDSFAVVSEVHETIAPVTLFKNVAGAMGGLVIQVVGPAILTSTSGAVTTDAGGNLVNVAPKVNWTPPPLIEIGPPGSPPTPVVIPPGGLNQNIVIPGLPLLRLEIGEPARAPDQAIPGADQTAPGVIQDTANNTDTAWGAVDVVRLTLLSQDPTSDVAQVRVGHMEAQALAPTGGIHCNAAVATSTTTSGGGGSTTTTGAGGGGTTTTTAAGGGGGTTTTTAANQGGGASTTTTAPGGGSGTTTTTAAGGNGNGNGTTTTTGPGASPGAGTSPPTTGPAQVQAVTFSQTPTAAAQTQTPNFTG